MSNYKLHYILQHLLPHKLISWIALTCADNKTPWIKNYLISYFLKRHKVNMAEAIEQDPLKYDSFNSFFTRKLKANARSIMKADIISPADGILAASGNLQNGSLIQAKGFNYTVDSLLGNSQHNFHNGSFATIYLAPHNYHRVHCPVSGKLQHMTYINGKLFSVSLKTTSSIPNIFSRNERVVTIFDNEQHGQVAVVLVGAMIVGGIGTVWDGQICPPHLDQPYNKQYIDQNMIFAQGDELGYFSLGSTVVIVTEKNNLVFTTEENQPILMGQKIANFLS